MKILAVDQETDIVITSLRPAILARLLGYETPAEVPFPVSAGSVVPDGLLERQARRAVRLRRFSERHPDVIQAHRDALDQIEAAALDLEPEPEEGRGGA